MKKKSLWGEIKPTPSIHLENKSKLETLDVIVVGGGITGLTTAYLLLKKGKRVAIVDRAEIGRGDTMATSAHLTTIVDKRYFEIVDQKGEETARKIKEGKEAAIDFIEKISTEENIACDFQRLPGYLFATEDSQVAILEKEQKTLESIEIHSSLTKTCPLPFEVPAAIFVPNQATFNPAKYLAGLAEKISKMGGHFLWNTPVLSIDDGRQCLVNTPELTLTASDVVVATYSPLSTQFFIQTKLSAQRSYVVAGIPSKPFGKGLYWDLHAPYHYIRNNGINPVLIGGEDHKTGTNENPAAIVEKLSGYSKDKFGLSKVELAWSGQILETLDGLPYIGRNSAPEHLFIATGFSGNGLTYGTLAGRILTDIITQGSSEWEDTFRPKRWTPLQTAARYISENKDYPLYFVKDRVAPSESVEHHSDNSPAKAGKKLCSHMGCYLHWNNFEDSWDCPCHGSRFSEAGEVINGPAVKNLAK